MDCTEGNRSSGFFLRALATMASRSPWSSRRRCLGFVRRAAASFSFESPWGPGSSGGASLRPEAIEDGKSGLLVKPDDSRALAHAIGLLLDNPEKAQELGRASRKRAELLFDETKMIDRICSLYEELITNSKPGSAQRL